MDIWQWLRFQGDNKQNERGSQGRKESQKGGPGEAEFGSLDAKHGSVSPLFMPTLPAP